jgi:hypothetical protein
MQKSFSDLRRHTLRRCLLTIEKRQKMISHTLWCFHLWVVTNRFQFGQVIESTAQVLIARDGFLETGRH